MAVTEGTLLDAFIERRRATAELHALVLEARRSGMSLRRIAEATGLSHETVRRITSGGKVKAA